MNDSSLNLLYPDMAITALSTIHNLYNSYYTVVALNPGVWFSMGGRDEARPYTKQI
jgi:hypothetical protein